MAGELKCDKVETSQVGLYYAHKSHREKKIKALLLLIE